MAATRALWTSLSTISSRLHRFDALAVGSDFDGTLVPLVAHSDHVVMPERARAACLALVRGTGARMGFFSGRALADLVPRVGVEPAWYAGVCGIEVRDASRRRRDPPLPGGAIPVELRRELRDWCALHPGTWVQPKGVACAVHYRELPARLHAAFAAGVRRRLQPVRDRVASLPGKKVFEVTPRAASDKGQALAQWLAGAPLRECVVYLGDDVNDEPCFPLVRRMGGIGIAVARRSTRAEFRVGSPAEAVWFLEWLGREWESLHG